MTASLGTSSNGLALSNDLERPPAPLESLPDDVLSHVLHELDLSSMARLVGVSKAMGGKVCFADYLRCR